MKDAKIAIKESLYGLGRIVEIDFSVAGAGYLHCECDRYVDHVTAMEYVGKDEHGTEWCVWMDADSE